MRTTPPVGLSELAEQLVEEYAGRLAPQFVVNVLRHEQSRQRTTDPEELHADVRFRLESWLRGGRYPL